MIILAFFVGLLIGLLFGAIIQWVVDIREFTE